ncbi:MAG: carbohydrate ABC transporter permease [Chloroflexi bacterium HGW-Chloroflexi-3]|nr:MAG: carbohydrate ABC transporter permease [Chloroflexi bacterium HGW-Chloroflexi-3]
MKIRKRHVVGIIKFVGTLIIALIFFAPFVLVILNSVKPQSQIMTDILGLPTTMMWENYSKAWDALNMSTVLTNTVIVSISSVFLILFLAAMVAYWMVRHPSKYSRVFEKLLLGSLLIPFASLMLPLVKTMSTLGLNTSLMGGILTYVGIGLAFATFIMTGAVRAVPVELEEAAMIDGCNVYQVFFQIVLPIIRPTFLTLFILDLFWIWNDYIVALIMLNNTRLNTVQLAINKLFGLHANQWDIALPAIVMSIAPILIINILLQKKIIAGIASGALKG